jgi:hypothetical protein
MEEIMKIGYVRVSKQEQHEAFQIGVITFFRTIFPAKQEENEAISVAFAEIRCFLMEQGAAKTDKKTESGPDKRGISVRLSAFRTLFLGGNAHFPSSVRIPL